MSNTIPVRALTATMKKRGSLVRVKLPSHAVADCTVGTLAMPGALYVSAAEPWSGEMPTTIAAVSTSARPFLIQFLIIKYLPAISCFLIYTHVLGHEKARSTQLWCSCKRPWRYPDALFPDPMTFQFEFILRLYPVCVNTFVTYPQFFQFKFLIWISVNYDISTEVTVF